MEAGQEGLPGDRPPAHSGRHHTSRRWRLGTLSAVALALVAGATKPGTAAPDYETPPVLRAADLAASPDLLQGPRFQVEPDVPTDGLLATFTIKSDFGTFVATGPGMLGIRVGEIHALEVLEKTEKSDIFSAPSKRRPSVPGSRS
jgi:hypothetical protein